MITSTRQYKDLTVIREENIQCGADWKERMEAGKTAGELVNTVKVERRLSTHTEIIMPYEPLFKEAVEATMELTASEIGKMGGSAKTEAKTAAARANGKKGGRPRRDVKCYEQ